MNKNNKTNAILILIVSILLITIISFSFAHFNTRISNNEISTTIASGSGIMEITYSGGENINAPNIFPDSNPFIIKEFTITGKNSNEEEMHYHLFLILDENTFRSSALTYTLESNNIDDNGYVAPEIISQTGIKTGEREIFLGNGMFTPTNKENKVHSYTLKLYFPKIEHFEHGVDQGKTFKAHIETREGEVYPGYNPDKGVNHPVLFTGMTPVKWDENNDEINTTEDDPDWYDYDEKRWANAKSLDGSYWVWIPRYAYKIETCYHMSGEECENLTGKQAGDINVKFLKSTTNLTEDNTIIETTGYEAHIKDTSMHHFLHPAFQFNGEELGFWIAKFKPSVFDQTSDCYVDKSVDNCNNQNINIKLIPDANIFSYISSYNSYFISKKMESKTDLYGWFSHELDSHMTNNHEWGAMAYLSKSQFGAYDNKVWNNSFNGAKTGCSGSIINAANESHCVLYNTANGVKASTTHNIYGVYDVSGSLWERVMANYNNLLGDSEFTLSKFYSLPYKYITKYITSEENIYKGFSMDFDSSVYGDALYEVANKLFKHNGSYWETGAQSWFSGYAYIPNKTHPWLVHSGHYSHENAAGLYGFSASTGEAKIFYTFRPVLTPL